MGATFTDVTIRDIAGAGQEYTGRFLVDTGAMECLVDRDRLTSIGVAPQGKNEYELADGSSLELEFGYVFIKVKGEETPVRVVFGNPGCEPLLGAIAMESLGFVVDPTSQTIRRVKSKRLK